MVRLLIDSSISTNDNFHVSNHKRLGEEYNCRSINPPFFNQIVILDNKLNDYDLKRVYNMCVINKKYFL